MNQLVVLCVLALMCCSARAQLVKCATNVQCANLSASFVTNYVCAGGSCEIGGCTANWVNCIANNVVTGLGAGAGCATLATACPVGTPYNCPAAGGASNCSGNNWPFVATYSCVGPALGAGLCEIATCTSPYYNCDGMDTNGCESLTVCYVPPTTSASPPPPPVPTSATPVPPPPPPVPAPTAAFRRESAIALLALIVALLW